MAATEQKQGSTLSVLAGVGLLFLAFQSTVSVLSIFVTDKFNADASQVGMLLTAFALAALVSRPIGGPLMARLGEKRAFAAAQLLFAISTGLIGVATSMPMLLGFRALQGFAQGIVTSAGGTLIAAATPSEKMNEAMSYFSMAINIPLIIGPGLGLWVQGSYGYQVYFAICVGLGIVATALAFFMPSANKLAIAAETLTNNQPAGNSLLDNFIERSAIPVGINVFFLGVGTAAVLAFVTIYGQQNGLLQYTGYFFMIDAFLISFARPVTAGLLGKIGEKAGIYIGIALLAGGLAMIGLLPNPVGYLGAAAIVGLGYGMLFPTYQSLILRMAPEHRTGYANSTFFLFIDSGVTLGSLAFGFVALWVSLQGMFLLSAALMCAMFLFFARATRLQGFPH